MKAKDRVAGVELRLPHCAIDRAIRATFGPRPAPGLASALLLGALAMPAAPALATNVPFATHPISTTANAAFGVAAADVDGDGDIDVLSASGLDNKVAWYQNDSSQGFTLRTISTTALGANSVAVADVDNDLDLDVLSASSDGKIAWYENDGSQGFTLRTISTTALGAQSVAAADVDGDGDMDALSASPNDNKLAWYENDGSQAFTLHTIATGPDALFVATADVDGDGDLDVLSAARDDDQILWYENDGSEAFTQHVISGTANGAWMVAAADVDGDGDVDALSASFADDKIAWYENDGSEAFTLHTIASPAGFARFVATADVDGDGDLDVLSATRDDDKVAWYENDGSQAFALHTISTAADGAFALATADVDGDGDMDVLSASPYDDEITWYENTCEAGTLQFRSAQMVASEADGRRAVRVDRTGGTCGAVAVSYQDLHTGTATPGVDYRDNLDGTLTFADGAANRHFNVRVRHDTRAEPNETIDLQLYAATGGATLGTSAATLRIRDDDGPPEVSISGPASVTEGNELLFTVTLDAPSGRDVEVLLGLHGTAMRALDFGFRPARFIIPAGSTSVTRDLRAGVTDVYSDGIADDGETIILSISAATNATVSPVQDSITVTVNDP